MASTVSAPAAVGPASTMADENAVNSNAPGVPPSNAAAAVVADKAPAKKKRNKKKRALITPTKNNDPRMTVEKGVVDELLLVCGVIGTTTNEGNELVPVTDCLNWLQDLQRALRRDDDQFRPISLLIGKWNVVQQKLLPLVMTCRYDTAIVLTVVKILVILTKPLAENTKRAGRMIIDTSSNKKNDPAVIAEQIKLRDNALEQAEMLMEYKRAVAHHSSHRTQSGSGLLSVLVSLLAAPLSKTGASRTDADHLTIELVLHLIRNLLSAEPLLNTSKDTSRKASLLHQELITLFDKELVFEIITVIGQEMELRENAQYNLLMMELLHHVLKSQDPTAVARAGLAMEKAASSSSAAASSASTQPPSAETSTVTASKATSGLAAKLKQEKAQKLALRGARHAHFGGTYMKESSDGKRSYFGATETQQTAPKRRNRKAEPFIGSGKTNLVHSKSGSFDQGPITKQAMETLNRFCQTFVKDCYGPVMKSLKNEFRRDSVRLEEQDKVTFFRIIWFFCQWWRVSRKKDERLGQLIFTMDVFTFNLVLNATDHYHEQKQHQRLAQTVSLYGEMMHLLNELYQSKEETENIMAMGLMDRIFYAGEPLDRLPKLLSRWTPGTYSREYLCDLAELCHVSMKILDANAKTCAPFKNYKQKTNDAMTKMKISAADFDVQSYILKKIFSPQLVSMYTHLLSQYAVNATHVNHRIVAMFLRIEKIVVASPDDRDADLPENKLASKTVTLAPMLYTIQLIMVMSKILNDQAIRKDKDYSFLLTYCTNFMYKFGMAAQKNPLLYIETLFKHGTPAKFCDLVSNKYVTEELRLIAEHDLLLQDQLNRDDDDDEPSASARGGAEPADESDDDEDEIEFTGEGVEEGEALNLKKKRRKRKKIRETMDDSDEEADTEKKSSEESNDNDEPQSKRTKPSQDDNSDSDSEDKDDKATEKPMDTSENDKVEREQVDDDADASKEEVVDSSSAKKTSEGDDKVINDDSDDEIDFGENDKSDSATAPKSKNRLVIDDDDDDE